MNYSYETAKVWISRLKTSFTETTWWQVTLVFLSSKLLILMAGYMAVAMVKGDQHISFLQVWSNWDGGWYLSIVQDGYKDLNYAFFPLYPLAVKGIMFVIKNPLIAALIASYTFNWLGLYFLFKLVKLRFPEEIAFRTVLYISIFPTAFFFSAAYSESLFFFVSVTSFYFGTKKRWYLAGVFAALASATRAIGFLVGLALIFQYIQEEMQAKKISNYAKLTFLAAISFLGLSGYAIFQYLASGDPLKFMHVYSSDAGKAEWNRYSKLPLDTLVIWKDMLFHYDWVRGVGPIEYIISGAMGILFLVLAIFLTYDKNLIHDKKFGVYGLYSMFSIIVPMSTGLESLWRYCLVIFPVFIFLAVISTRYRYLHEFLVSSSAILLGVFTSLYVNGYHIT